MAYSGAEAPGARAATARSPWGSESVLVGRGHVRGDRTCGHERQTIPVGLPTAQSAFAGSSDAGTAYRGISASVSRSAKHIWTIGSRMRWRCRTGHLQGRSWHRRPSCDCGASRHSLPPASDPDAWSRPVGVSVGVRGRELIPPHVRVMKEPHRAEPRTVCTRRHHARGTALTAAGLGGGGSAHPSRSREDETAAGCPHHGERPTDMPVCEVRRRPATCCPVACRPGRSRGPQTLLR